LGIFVKITELAQTFFHDKMYLLIFTKNGLGSIMVTLVLNHLHGVVVELRQVADYGRVRVPELLRQRQDAAREPLLGGHNNNFSPKIDKNRPKCDHNIDP
jgi:hypothetical protein